MSDLAAREPDARYLRLAEPQGTLVDSCVLIDVLADDPVWADWSLEQLDRCGSRCPGTPLFWPARRSRCIARPMA
ncbi:MAG: hypothetical protein NT071_12260 [Burkholderiales bacterium]|nr:hypothetical protein [Burkholderiales bacterium]